MREDIVQEFRRNLAIVEGRAVPGVREWTLRESTHTAIVPLQPITPGAVSGALTDVELQLPACLEPYTDQQVHGLLRAAEKRGVTAEQFFQIADELGEAGVKELLGEAVITEIIGTALALGAAYKLAKGRYDRTGLKNKTKKAELKARLAYAKADTRHAKAHAVHGKIAHLKAKEALRAHKAGSGSSSSSSAAASAPSIAPSSSSSSSPSPRKPWAKVNTARGGSKASPTSSSAAPARSGAAKAAVARLSARRAGRMGRRISARMAGRARSARAPQKPASGSGSTGGSTSAGPKVKLKNILKQGHTLKRKRAMRDTHMSALEKKGGFSSRTRNAVRSVAAAASKVGHGVSAKHAEHKAKKLRQLSGDIVKTMGRRRRGSQLQHVAGNIVKGMAKHRAAAARKSAPAKKVSRAPIRARIRSRADLAK